MAGKNSWPSIKPGFCCCPSVFGERGQWLTVLLLTALKTAVSRK